MCRRMGRTQAGCLTCNGDEAKNRVLHGYSKYLEAVWRRKKSKRLAIGPYKMILSSTSQRLPERSYRRCLRPGLSRLSK